MQDIYQTFEFHKIRDSIKEYSKTEVARDNIDDLVMFSSLEELRNALEDLKEMMSICTRFGVMPIQTSADAIYLIDMAKKTALLTPRDLNLIADDILTSQKITKFLSKIDVDYPRIKEKASKFFDLTNLEKEIHRVITNCLTIDDKATPELHEIRKSIKKEEALLQQKIATLSFTYSSYLNDDNATIRDGHFVLPVKTADKSKVLGIVYDVSDSGATTFIEPMEIVQINNKLTALKAEENEECRKILKALTALVLLQEGEIINNNVIIADFDFLIAKSLYAAEINADVAESLKNQEIELVNARHPLIDVNKVVANSYKLTSEERIVIISGPNAGGKTVSLKTVGLLVLMNQCGLAVPASKARLGYFNHIFVDIGDNQSLSDNLSTFSAHMSHIAEIINVVKGKDLVLIDELGTGTDPREGEALAYSVTKYLESKHALCMISSHFDALKEYAFLSKNLVNSSMIFDEEKLLPTYKFKEGVPGHSYALDVATRYGISHEIVDDAKKFLKSGETSDANERLSILQKKIEESSRLEDELLRKEREFEQREKKLANDEKIIKERRDNLLSSVEKEKKQIIENTQKEIDAIISQMSKGDMKLHEVIELKKELEELETNPETIIYDEAIELNDYVSVPSLNMNGKVVRLKGSKAHVVCDNGMAFDVEINKLHKIATPKQTSKPKVTHGYDQLLKLSVGLELNIIGLRVDEAKFRLEKYLDDCRLKRFSTVRIIHGFGTGALRNMVKAYLDTQKDLTYRPGHMNEGAGGATVVMFK